MPLHTLVCLHRSVAVPPHVSYSSSAAWGQSKLPEVFGSVGGHNITNANASPPWAIPQGSEGMEQVKNDSTVDGMEEGTFPKAPSSHENPSIYYDPLALLVN